MTSNFAAIDLVVLLAKREHDLAVEDVERVVLLGVDVRLQRAAGLERDDPEREARGVGRAGEELDVPVAGALSGRDDDGAVHARDRMVRA